MIAALDTEDKKKGALAALLFIIGVFVFLFLYTLPIPDPPLQEELLELEVDMGSMAAGGSAGTPQENENAVVNNQQEQTETEEIETQDDESAYVPSSDGSTETNETTTTEKQPDSQWDFGQQGDGGKGNGEGGKLGDGEDEGGNGNKTGSGDGGYNPSRKQLSGACTEGINSQSEGIIALDIWVDDNGKVVRTKYNEGKSNTGSQELIRLAEKASKCMRYEERPGTGTQKVKTVEFKFKKQ